MTLYIRLYSVKVHGCPSFMIVYTVIPLVIVIEVCRNVIHVFYYNCILRYRKIGLVALENNLVKLGYKGVGRV